jgi:hypothetical protein
MPGGASVTATHGAAGRSIVLQRGLLLLTLIAGGLLLGSELNEDWFPHDEGTLGQSAERILSGEVPHRDFDEIYTGLLSYVHAAVFTVLPTSSRSMRAPLFVGAMVWLWSMYRIMLRFAAPPLAALTTVTAMVWSVPNYPAPIPSWYILFCATSATLALIKWSETRGTWWLVLAGASGGIAFLLKLSGLLVFLGGGLAVLALLTVERTRSEGEHRGLHAWLVALVCVAATLALVKLVTVGAAEFVRLALPLALLLVALAVRSLRPTSTEDGTAWRRTASALGPLALGGTLPVLLFGVALGLQGALPMLVEGVFVTPFRRTALAQASPAQPLTLLLSLPVILFLLARPRSPGAWRLLLGAAAGWFGLVVLLAPADALFYRFGWMSIVGLLPLVAVLGAIHLLRSRESDQSGVEANALLLGCMAVSITLIEFPFAAPIYVLYAFPLTLLAAVALLGTVRRAQTGQLATFLLFLGLFGSLRVMPYPVPWKGDRIYPHEPTVELTLPRSGIRVPESDARVFETLIPTIQTQAAGRPIWAGPDAPEVYFLTGIPNRTRTMFDFLAPDFGQQPSPAELVDSLGAGVAVVKLRTQFSAPLDSASIARLGTRFREGRRIGDYLVLWR